MCDIWMGTRILCSFLMFSISFFGLYMLGFESLSRFQFGSSNATPITGAVHALCQLYVYKRPYLSEAAHPPCVADVLYHLHQPLVWEISRPSLDARFAGAKKSQSFGLAKRTCCVCTVGRYSCAAWSVPYSTP